MEQPTCPWCGGDVSPAAGARVRIYCSPSCKQKAKDARKTARYRTDSEYRAQVCERRVAHAREQGARPIMDPTPRPCAHCGADFTGAFTRRYCSTRCSRLAEKIRLGGTGKAEVIIGAILRKYGKGDSLQRLVTVRVNRLGGLIVTCPNPSCRRMMHTIAGRHQWHERECMDCGTTLILNEEEARWVTSEMDSISRSLRIAS